MTGERVVQAANGQRMGGGRGVSGAEDEVAEKVSCAVFNLPSPWWRVEGLPKCEDVQWSRTTCLRGRHLDRDPTVLHSSP